MVAGLSLSHQESAKQEVGVTAAAAAALLLVVVVVGLLAYAVEVASKQYNHYKCMVYAAMKV